ncbi:MAG: sugar phosphate isomerase/epimerase family protein [Aristaeellaceae bacterium]
MEGILLGLGLSDEYGLPLEAQIPLMRRVGFRACFAEWRRGVNLERLCAIVRAEGMLMTSVHAPFGRMHKLWEPDGETADVLAELLSCLRACADNGIPVMVAHAIIGMERNNPTEQGVDHFARLAEEAERLGVRIALENTEGEEYLAALLDAFRGSDAVGFCWDSGHEMCYNHGRDLLALYGDRLLCTHLNDNLGVSDAHGRITFLDDLHLLPFDGVADWAGIARRLNRHAYQGVLTFELNRVSKPGRRENDAYGRMSPEEYLTQAFARASRVAALKARCL